ncbi:MAG: response regulator [Desulfobacterales bacterium]|jgi:DNA-binding response OmpR family regulator|nr:response regulator [Desulfobacterales bacterium]
MDPDKDTLLIVDDNATNLSIMQALLDKEEYRTVITDNSLECLDILKSLTPNLILLDIDMPDMNGLEVCRIVKQDSRSSEIPIIFVTGLTDNKTINDAFECGGTDYIKKPINRVELLARIKSVLARQKYKQSLLEKERLAGVLEMAGAVCHELNQPLQVIQLYVDAIDSAQIKEKGIRDALEQIRRQTVRMGSITKKIMQITKYESRDYLEGVRIIDIEKASSPKISGG